MKISTIREGYNFILGGITSVFVLVAIVFYERDGFMVMQVVLVAFPLVAIHFLNMIFPDKSGTKQ